MQDASIHWDGEPVAVAIAETLEQAEYAASLVKVEYEAVRGLRSPLLVISDGNAG